MRFLLFFVPFITYLKHFVLPSMQVVAEVVVRSAVPWMEKQLQQLEVRRS